MKSMNSNILKITYVFVGLFTILAGYLMVYLFTDSKDDINNSYNKRQEILAQKIRRGSIYANDMTILAKTVVDEDKNETRVYPYDELFCHVVGSYDKGVYGLEQSYNYELLSANQSIIDEVLADLNNEKLLGNGIVTTLDLELQDVCYKALGEYDGAIVIMDATSGDILSMVSKPDYNPNDISKIWNDIKEDDKGVLLNRATQGLYPPGSVFKLFTLGEYIASNSYSYESFLYTCEGSVSFTDFTMRCSNKKAHGKLDLKNAFANSCNCAFVEIGLDLDLNSFREYCNNKLFNSKEMPIDIAYKRSIYNLQSSDSTFIKCQTVIGQGETLVTPMHMCMVISSIVNDGVLMKPRFVERIVDNNGNTLKTLDESEYINLYTKEETEILKTYLREVVNSGTAYRLKNEKLDIYGKTGTAQISSSGKADSWFVGGIETQGSNKYAIAVVIENINDNTAPSVVVAKEIIKSLDKIEE